MLSSDGKVAQQGSYDELSKDRHGAFTQLMEWQMSGGETGEGAQAKAGPGQSTPPVFDDQSDIAESMAEEAESEGDEDEEALKSKASDEAGLETVAEKSKEEK